MTRRVRDDGASPAQNSYVTQFELDLVGRIIQRNVLGQDGEQTPVTHIYKYDSLGNLSFYQDPDQVGDSNRFARTVFDADGRWVRFTKSASASSAIELTSEYLDTPSAGSSPEIVRRDGRGLATTWIYDGAYRLAELRRPGWVSSSPQAHRTTIGYDAGSRPTNMTDGNGTTIQQSWDLLARRFVRQVTVGSGVSLLATEETLEFDPLGRLAKAWTDQGAGHDLFLGGVDVVTDSLGRKQSEAFTYTGIDLVHPVLVESEFGYTGGGNVGDAGFRRGLNYDTSGFEIGSVPDPIGRLEKRTLKLPGASNAFDLATYTWGGGTALERDTSLGGAGSLARTTTLDAYRRLEKLQHTASDGSTSADQIRTFAWSPGGDLLKRGAGPDENSPGDLFQYDGFHRLIGAKLGVADISQSYGSATAARAIDYALEAGQSRLSVTESLNGGTPDMDSYETETTSPRYELVGGIAPLYDGEGNVAFDGNYFYVYDFKNRLSEVYQAVAAGSGATAMQLAGGLNTSRAELDRGRSDVRSRFGQDVAAAARSSRSQRTSSRLEGRIPQTSVTTSQTVEFELVLIAAYGYDPFNRRIVRIAPEIGVDVRYSYDGWREVEELAPVSQNGTIVAQAHKVMVWGAVFTELLSYHRWEDQGGGQWGWTGYLVSQDEQGSVTWLHRADGTEVERVEYDPYGERLVEVNQGGTYVPQAMSSVGLDVSYTGHRHDVETGLLYARNRYLRTDWGRFMTLDPLGPWADKGNLGNGYGYVGNSPAIASDPSGLLSIAGGYGGGVATGSDGGNGAGSDGWVCGMPGNPGTGDFVSGGSSPDPEGVSSCGGDGSLCCECQDPGPQDGKPQGGLPAGPLQGKPVGLWLEGPGEGDREGHISIAIGDPNGEYVQFSFGAEGYVGVLTNEGAVYEDPNKGGEIDPDNYYEVSPNDAQDIVRRLRDIEWQPGHYSLLNQNCRWWSRNTMKCILDYHKLKGIPIHKGTPPPRSVTGPSGAVPAGVTTTTTTRATTTTTTGVTPVGVAAGATTVVLSAEATTCEKSNR